jgi:hypothetical protein
MAFFNLHREDLFSIFYSIPYFSFSAVERVRRKEKFWGDSRRIFYPQEESMVLKYRIFQQIQVGVLGVFDLFLLKEGRKGFSWREKSRFSRISLRKSV